MARHVRITLAPEEDSSTSYNLTIQAATWDAFLEQMVKENFHLSEAVTIALENWTESGRGVR